jgi:hypothetical protein
VTVREQTSRRQACVPGEDEGGVDATTGLGITLPFGVYMAISSALSVVLGPVGFIGLGLFALLKITGPEHQKMTTAVVAICAIRSRIEMERCQSQPRRSPWKVWVVWVAAILAVCLSIWLLSRARP